MDATSRAPIYASTVISASKPHETNHMHYDNVSSYPYPDGHKTTTTSTLALHRLLQPSNPSQMLQDNAIIHTGSANKSCTYVNVPFLRPNNHGDTMQPRNIQPCDNKKSLQYQQPSAGYSNTDQVSHNIRCSVNQFPYTPTAIEETSNSNYLPTTMQSSPSKPMENTRQVPPALKHPSASTGDLLPGIDLDAVALMMQGGKGYPQRPVSRPLGPRDPPTHFQRKQEYL